MKNKNIKTAGKRLGFRFRHFIIILLSVLIFFTAVELITLILQKGVISSQYGQANQSEKIDHSLYSQEVVKMLREKAYLTGRIDMAKTNGISLVVDLEDSVIRLELKGVVIHKAPILNYSKSRLFEYSDQFAISKLLSFPGTVISYEGTLPKEAIIVKIAPKDTTEANNRPNIAPDTSKIEAVYYNLKLDNGINLHISQIEEKSYKGKLAGFIFYSREYFSALWNNTTTLISLKRPKLQINLWIKMDAKDGRIIYRSLPPNAHVTVRL